MGLRIDARRGGESGLLARRQPHVDRARDGGRQLGLERQHVARFALEGLAQRCLSARASISCAVIRTRSPERETDPSTIASTLSVFAICGVGGRFFPLNCIAEPRDVTRSWLIVARSPVSSSVIPSAKYSCVESPE